MSAMNLRVLFFAAGLVVLSFGVTLTIKGSILGVGSWDVLHIGLANYALTIGTWSILTGLVILLIGVYVNKQVPKMGTWINMFSIGILIDLFNAILPNVTTVWMQVMCFCAGILLLGFGCGMYIVANFGAGPRDSLMILLTERLHWSVTKSRTIIEVTVAVIGFIIGGPVGVGTVLMAFGLGPIVSQSLKFNEKLFQRLCNESYTVQAH